MKEVRSLEGCYIKGVKVTVLIYVLNDQSHIEKCVRSVMAQLLRELEILLIDGGSTDGTLEIIGQLQQEDERIRLIRSEAGVGYQFNTGLQAAKGKYIGICESDDYLLPDMYECQYEVAEKYELDVLKANVLRFCENDEGEEYSFLFSLSADNTLYDTLIYPQEDPRFLRLGVNGFWSGLYSREFLEKHALHMNETKGASYQDVTFSFLTELYARRAYVMSDAFYCYRMDNPSSSVNSPRKISLLSTEYELLKEQLKQRGLWGQSKEIYWRWRTGGYFWFYDNLSDSMRTDYLPLLYREIRTELKEEAYTEAELDKKEKGLCLAAGKSLDSFIDFISENDNEWRQTQQKISVLNVTSDVVIFGTGNLGALVNCYLAQSGNAAVAGIDNASWKWNTEINGLNILSPEEGVKRYPYAIYIIANAAHGSDMSKQLMQLGVKEDQIILCNNYDLFLKKILVDKIKRNRKSNEDRV